MALSRSPHERASILVGLLWCLVLLSLVVVGVLHTARMDLMVQKNYGDRIQAHYLALAGIEKTKALLFQDAFDRRHSARNHSGDLYDSEKQFHDVPFANGTFSVFRRARPDEGEGIIYGIGDEECRLNVNTAPAEQFTNLVNMTPDVIAAIMDWRDADNDVTPGGAESDYYMSLQPPYLPRNGPLQTVRELLMVRGITSDLLLGTDTEAQKVIGPGDDNGQGNSALITPDGILDGGWSGFLTVDSIVNNLNAAGDDRVNVQSADEHTLTGINGITPAIARAIISYRGQNQFKTIADLLDVTAGSSNQGASGTPQGPAAQNAGGSSGPTVISQDLLQDIADDITVVSDDSQPGAVNINTASEAVLNCLPGLDPQLSHAIVSYRKSSGYFPNPAHLLKVPGMTRDIFKQLAQYITARSETFRILCEGKVTSSGTRQRIQMIVHLNVHNIDTLSYREDL